MNEAPTVPSFRRHTDKEGNPIGWKVFGPANLVEAGKIALVTKKDGSETEVLIERVSKTFVVEGVECVYGYIAERGEG